REVQESSSQGEL
ncbi:hypothetical protein CP8484711_2626B, partial [Chlamydia psittaci 84-8471/1]